MKQDLVLLEARNDGVYVLKNPDIECPSLPILMQFIALNGIIKYDEKALSGFVQSGGNAPIKIADRHVELENDYSLSITISKDYMEASMMISPPFFTKPWPTLEQVKQALSEKKISYGIEEENIRHAIEERIAAEPVVVAKGLAPVAGKDGWVELKIDPTVKVDHAETDEKIDHRERGLFTNVAKGDLLAVRYPPTEGVDGINIVNIPVKAKPGREIPLPGGAGTVPSEDGMSLLADTDGCLKKSDNKLTVSPELNIPGNVDYHTGNINFVGSVRIRGAVCDGFQIIAAGDIEVFEMVEGAYLESKGGILVRGGIRGMSKAKVIAAGKIELGFVDQAVIIGGADVNIRNAALHSDISAGGSVIVGGGQKPQIAGGKVHAAVGVVCATLGSEMGTKTEVVVGISPMHAERRKELMATIAAQNETSEKLDSNLAFLKKLEAAQSLDDTKRALLLSITKSKFQLQSQQKAAQTELTELEQMLEVTKAQGIVRVKGVCYPGVHITMRGVTHIIKEPFKYCSFVFEDGEIKLRSYDYNTRSVPDPGI